MDIKRRALLAQPGEPLIASLSPIEAAVRFKLFAEATGIDEGDMVTSPLCSLPLPHYPERFEGGARRWLGVRPDAMWHPLLWLPDALAARTVIRSADGDRVEDDDAWSVRVALGLTDFGFYDVDSGTWVDILSMVDVDVDIESDVERVGRWLEGAPDTDLDDLGSEIEGLVELAIDDRADLALRAAVAVDALWVQSWAYTADALRETCADLGRSVDQSRGPRRSALMIVAELAQSSFAVAPLDDPRGSQEQAYWTETADRLAHLADTDAFGARALLEEMSQRLTALHERYWPMLLARAGGPGNHAATGA